MANNPQWGTLTIEIPDFLEEARDSINNVAEFIVNVLDIVMVALQFVKGFLIAFLDPIIALVQSIIDDLNGLIRDIRQMGIYITGDWHLFEYPFTDLRGGYQEYERRMIARLTDKTDPTRPNVSSRTMVLGMFFYLSVDLEDIQQLIAFIMQLVAFFQQDWTSNILPSVTVTEMRYGLDTIGILTPTSMGNTFKTLADSGLSGDVPKVAQVRFKTYAPNKNQPFKPFPANALGPDGFAITVSTIPDGISLKYDKPRLNSNTEPGTVNTTEQVQPRDYGSVRGQDGKPVVLYGGSEMLSLPKALSYNAATKNNAPQTGKIRIYGATDSASNAPMPLELLGGTDGPYFQRTFWMDKSDVLFKSFTGEYSFNMRLDDMPYEGVVEVNEDGTVSIQPVLDSQGQKKRADTVFVRVATCNKKAIGKFKYDFGNAAITKLAAAPGYIIVPVSDGLALTDIGQWSQPKRITFPTVYTAQYMQAVQTALVVLVLCRPDLTPMDQLRQILTPQQIAKIDNGQLLIEGTAAQECGLESLTSLLNVIYDDVNGPIQQWQKSGEQPTDFRTDLIQRVRRFTQLLYDRTGPMPDVEKRIVDNTVALRSVTWREILDASPYTNADRYMDDRFLDATILESIDTSGYPGNQNDFGIALNPWCIGIPEADKMWNVSGMITGRAPGMFELSVGDKTVYKNSVPGDEVAAYLDTLPPNMKAIYEAKGMIDDSGNMVLDRATFQTIQATQPSHLEGSGDHSPVLVIDRSATEDSIASNSLTSNATITFTRSLITDYDNGILITEAQAALSMAGSIWKRSDDGEWIAIRFLDVMPGIDDFLTTVRNWAQAIKDSLKSIVDTMLKYIEWLQSRIMELQQLIRRINALIQSLLGFTFQIPACSGLMCYSNGTDGILADFVSAQDKPDDGALAYSAGVAMIVPTVPSFVYSLLQMLFQRTDGTPVAGQVLGGDPPPAGVPLQGLPGTPPPGGDVPPDVL